MRFIYTFRNFRSLDRICSTHHVNSNRLTWTRTTTIATIKKIVNSANKETFVGHANIWWVYRNICWQNAFHRIWQGSENRTQTHSEKPSSILFLWKYVSIRETKTAKREVEKGEEEKKDKNKEKWKQCIWLWRFRCVMRSVLLNLWCTVLCYAVCVGVCYFSLFSWLVGWFDA